MNYQYHTLKNGLRIVFRKNDSIVTHSGVYINVGSRDEQGDNEGMAHFIEHSIFKGTEHRKSLHILNRIDGVGGELNAFTTKEETCVYASSLNEHLERCLDLFADILFHSNFPEKEIEKEKDVVLEEINSYKDYPAELIYDDFEEEIFKGHPLAHNILGNKKNVKRFSSKKISTFMQENYTTDRMVISIVGNQEWKKVISLCEKFFGSYPCNTSKVDRSVKPSYQPFSLKVNKHTHQVHALLGFPTFDAFDDNKVAFSLLNNILGGPAMNSRLNVAIREKYGFCYTIESQFTPFSDAGLFYIYSGIEADAIDQFLELVWMELKKMCRTPLTIKQLQAAQKQMIGQMAINNESGLNEMQSIGKSFLIYDKVDTMEEMCNDIMKVTPSDIMKVANTVFREDKLSQLFFL